MNDKTRQTHKNYQVWQGNLREHMPLYAWTWYFLPGLTNDRKNISVFHIPCNSSYKLVRESTMHSRSFINWREKRWHICYVILAFLTLLVRKGKNSSQQGQNVSNFKIDKLSFSLDFPRIKTLVYHSTQHNFNLSKCPLWKGDIYQFSEVIEQRFFFQNISEQHIKHSQSCLNTRRCSYRFVWQTQTLLHHVIWSHDEIDAMRSKVDFARLMERGSYVGNRIILSNYVAVNTEIFAEQMIS